MKINVEINNPAGVPVDKKFVERIAAAVIEKEAARFGGIMRMEISLVFVVPGKIRQLNKRYRQTDCVTDVLSFSGDGPICGSNSWSLGELIICARQIENDAKELKTTFDKELAWVIIHGILHLFGENHEKKVNARRMQAKERFYLSRISLR